MRKILLMFLASLMAVLGFAGTASASTYNGQQLRFYDDSPDQGINSIKVSGTNQDGVDTIACIPTPQHTTEFPDWWWSGQDTPTCSRTQIRTASTNEGICGSIYPLPLTVTIGVA